MSYKSSNKREIWKSYCVEHSDLITELGVNDWVFHTEDNFREFVTFGFMNNKKDSQYSFKKLSDKQYENLFHFVTNYFDMDMQYFTNLNQNLPSLAKP